MPLTSIGAPCLHGKLAGSIAEIEEPILQNHVKIECWFREQFKKTPPPIYASADLRNCGFKLAPVDTNLFPAGFNNLSPDSWPLAIQAASITLEQKFPGCQRILLIPESHTRNIFYLESVVTLQNILLKAGYDVRLGSLLTDITEPLAIDLPSKRQIILEPIRRTGERLGLDNFNPCIILLNNDLSEGPPEILQNIEQPAIPPMHIGWDKRSKSKHFFYYQNIAQEFANLISIDPWRINPYFQTCSKINFMTGEGEECLYHHASTIYQMTEEKYKALDIDQKPFVVIKADAGTYGMGVMMIHHPDELKHLNRKDRNRMSATKGGRKIDKVIIQEGVYSFETVGPNDAVAEPVVYMIGQHVVSGFYRVHTKRGSNENLNAPGMHFEPLAFCAPCNSPEENLKFNCESNLFYTYGVIARLALLASAQEIAELES